VKRTTKEPESEGLTRIVGLDDLDSESLPLRRWNELGDLPDGTSFTRVFRAGQVLFGKRRAYQRKVAVADFDGVCSGDILVFEPSTDELLSGFLPYIVQSDDFFNHALGTSAGSLSPRTKWQELAKYEFALPPVPEQEIIVGSLRVAETALAAAANTLRCAQTLKDAIVDEAIWDREGRTWRVPLRPVGELLNEKPRNGLSPRTTESSGSIRSVTLSAIRNGESTANALTEKWCEPDDRMNDFLVSEGEVFVVRGNGNRRLVGRAGIARETPEPPCIYPDLLIRLRFDRSQIDSRLATEIWNSTRVHETLLARAKSTNGIYKVNGKDISRHELPVPAADHGAAILEQLNLVAQVVDLAVGHVDEAFALARALRERLLNWTDQDV